MFENNNQVLVRKLSQKSFQANSTRNMFVIIALALTTFMITAVFSIGFSYTKTNQLQQLRMMGTAAHTAVTGVSEEQAEQIGSSKEGTVSAVGRSHRLGSIDGEGTGGSLLGMVWLDETEWSIHRLPTVTGVTGEYPTAQNEVMMPTWVLDKMGIEDPVIGMEIPLSYRLSTDNVRLEAAFVLSGFYTDYMQVRTGDRGALYVSKAFRQATGIPFEQGGAAMITFQDQEQIGAYCEQLKKSMGFGEDQTFEPVPLYEPGNRSMATVLFGVIAVIMTAGYLLIYNILYLSVSKDIRFYGQLKTLGTTRRQIRHLILLQVVLISAIGIPIGLLAGAAVSFGIVPFFLNVFSASDAALGVTVSFSPKLFVCAALFSFLTAMGASLKPAHMAADCSPVEAAGYTGVQCAGKSQRNSYGGASASHMAWRNLFRNRKSAVLVFASLFFGLTLFLLSTGLLGSLSPKNFVAEQLGSDIALILQSRSGNDVLTETLAAETAAQSGAVSVRTALITAPYIGVPVTYTEETYGSYIKSLATNPEIKGGVDFSDEEVIKTYLFYFTSYVYGIDSEYATELEGVDVEAFERGDIILLHEAYNEQGVPLFEIGQEVELVSEQTGSHSYQIGGFLEEDFLKGGDRGAAPNIYMSKQALERLSPNYKIGRIDIDTDGRQDAAVLAQLKQRLGGSSEVKIVSRYEKEQQIAGYIASCQVLGTGLSVILLLIGVMNFINTMFVSVTTRRQELAVLESIGMTAKQIKTMLVLEGVYYFLISFAMLGTIGSALFAVSYHALSRVAAYAVFTYPAAPLFLAAVVILIACIAVPLAACRAGRRKSVVERIRVKE